MTDMERLSTDDGTELPLNTWLLDDGPIIQLLHGLGEHSGRYERFALAMNEIGVSVVAHDHRGHGAAAELRGWFAEKHGWQTIINDSGVVLDHLKERFPDRRIVLMGHSMGSFIAQCVAMDRSNDYAAMILSGSTWPPRAALFPGLVLSKIVSLIKGTREPSPFLDGLGFGRLNKAFTPTRTDYDWLSRDEAEVDKYINDPLCGGPFTTSLWVDFLGGMMRCGSDGSISRIRSDIPIMILGGEKDPVGGDKGLGELMTHYAQTGHSRLKLKIYEGGRHEMLNETNRDEVTADIAEWLKGLPIFG